MWIMLIKKLPTYPSPPKLAIFWSEPWPNKEYAAASFDRLYTEEDLGIGTKRKGSIYYRLDDNTLIDRTTVLELKYLYMLENAPDLIPMPAIGRGLVEHNYAKARMIEYKGERIRVFEDEFTTLSRKNMEQCIGYNGEGSHELIPEGYFETNFMKESLLEGTQKDVYDASLVDGATHQQAQLMAFGVDVKTESPDSNMNDLPKLGWYRCKREYAEIYCYENEMTEDYGDEHDTKNTEMD